MVEVSVAAAIGLIAAVVGALCVANWDGRAMFWQNMFGPAVTMACGDGWSNPYFGDVPALADFLELRTEAFDCAALEASHRAISWDTTGMSFEQIQEAHPTREFPGFTQWQKFHFYLLFSVSLCWWIFGVSWAALLPLYGLLYGATCALAYGFFRLCMRRWIAVLFVAMLVFSPLHLEQLPHLRDYSKAPFFMAAFLAIAWFTRAPRERRTALGVAALTGFCLGVGIGFRQDVLIALAGVLGAILIFGEGRLREAFRARLIVSGVLVAAFLIPATPILLVLQRNSNAPHDTLIGLLDYTEQRIGVDNSLYDHGDPFLDEYTRAQVETYAWYEDGHDTPLRHYSGTYDHYAGAYFRKVFLYFPADMVARAFATVVRVLDELGPRPTQPVPVGIDAWYAVIPFELRAFVAWFIDWGNRYTTALVIILLAAIRPKWGWAALCMLYLFAGYTSLRFSVRHAFHLEFVSLWTSGMLLHLALHAIAKLRASRGKKGRSRKTAATLAGMLAGWKLPDVRPGVLRALRFTVLAVLLTVVPLWVLRGYQQIAVGEVIGKYEKTPRVPVEMTVGQRGGEAWFVPKSFAQNSRIPDDERQRPSQAAYLVGSIASGDNDVPLTFHFKAEDYHYNYTRTITIPAGKNETVYFPVFYGEDNVFQGVSTPLENHARIEEWQALGTLETLPLYLNLTLPEDWRSRARYQTFSR